MSRIDSLLNLSPLYTVVSRNVISFSEISAVNFQEQWPPSWIAQRSLQEEWPPSWMIQTNPLPMPHIPADRNHKTRESPTYLGLKELPIR